MIVRDTSHSKSSERVLKSSYLKWLFSEKEEGSQYTYQFYKWNWHIKECRANIPAIFYKLFYTIFGLSHVQVESTKRTLFLFFIISLFFQKTKMFINIFFKIFAFTILWWHNSLSIQYCKRRKCRCCFNFVLFTFFLYKNTYHREYNFLHHYVTKTSSIRMI